MPRKYPFDEARMNRILAEQYRVISRAQVLTCGMSPRALHRRIASSGPCPPLPIKGLPPEG